jgi:pyruvate dehydrogenase E2 component (dihydrolipoamide acetyltransferase)
VPDIGSSGKAQIIEIQVKVGDTVEADQSLITLESDKASMEIPSPAAGVVKAISVKLNDEVGTGDLILDLEVAGAAAPAAAAPAQAAAPAAAAPACRCCQPHRWPTAFRTSTFRTSVRRARPRSSKCWSRPATALKPTSR